MNFIGVDLGGTDLKVGLISSSGEKLKFIEEKVCSREYGNVLSQIKSAVEKLKMEQSVIALGVASPGLIDDRTKTVTYSNNFNWNNSPLGHDLEKLTGLPVAIANDAKLACLGESTFGAGKGYKDVAMLTLGTGVGGGYVRDGKLFSGLLGADSLFGHITVCMDGRQCTCGRKGCLEAYASATAIVNEAKRIIEVNKNTCLVKSDISSKSIFDSAKLGDSVAKKLVEDFLNYLADGVCSIINILRPNVVIIGGGVSKAGKIITDAIEDKLPQNVYGFSCAKTEIRLAELGNDAGMIGAAHLAATTVSMR